MLLRASEKISIFKILFTVSDPILPVCYNVITRLKDPKINSNKLDMSLGIYKKYRLNTKKSQ